MGKTLQHIALAAFALIGALSVARGSTPTATPTPPPGVSPEDLTIRGFELTATSGTLELQRVRAEAGALTPDGRMVAMRDLSFRLSLASGENVEATAAEGFVMIAGERRAEVQRRPSYPEVAQYGARFETEAGNGDVLLRSEEGPTRVTFGNRGRLETQQLVWSEHLGRLLLPTSFRQEGSFGGAEVKVSGGGLTVDRQLRHWVYFAGPDEPAVMEFLRPADDAEAPQRGTTP